jgi:hypothetical protein
MSSSYPIGLSLASVTLTSTDLANLSGTAITLLPAPGTGLMHNVVGVDLVYNFGTTAYTAYTGDIYIATKAIGGTTTWAAQNVRNILYGSVSYRYLGSLTSYSQYQILSDFSNQPVIAQGSSSGYSVSGGDGTLTINLIYATVPA